MKKKVPWICDVICIAVFINFLWIIHLDEADFKFHFHHFLCYSKDLIANNLKFPDFNNIMLDVFRIYDVKNISYVLRLLLHSAYIEAQNFTWWLNVGAVSCMFFFMNISLEHKIKQITIFFCCFIYSSIITENLIKIKTYHRIEAKIVAMREIWNG